LARELPPGMTAVRIDEDVRLTTVPARRPHPPRAVGRMRARAASTGTRPGAQFGCPIGVGGRAWSAWCGIGCEAAASGRAAADGCGGRHRRGDRL
jgi:hypothetical protein